MKIIHNVLNLNKKDSFFKNIHIIKFVFQTYLNKSNSLFREVNKLLPRKSYLPLNEQSKVQYWYEIWVKILSMLKIQILWLFFIIDNFY